MAVSTHSTRRQVLAGAIAAGTVAVCAKPAAAALAATAEAEGAAAESELRALFNGASREEKRMIIEALQWVVDGQAAADDPRKRWPAEYQERQRAAGLM